VLDTQPIVIYVQVGKFSKQVRVAQGEASCGVFGWKKENARTSDLEPKRKAGDRILREELCVGNNIRICICTVMMTKG
jgi:hypothetical protein